MAVLSEAVARDHAAFEVGARHGVRDVGRLEMASPSALRRPQFVGPLRPVSARADLQIAVSLRESRRGSAKRRSVSAGKLDVALASCLVCAARTRSTCIVAAKPVSFLDASVHDATENRSI